MTGVRLRGAYNVTRTRRGADIWWYCMCCAATADTPLHTQRPRPSRQHTSHVCISWDTSSVTVYIDRLISRLPTPAPGGGRGVDDSEGAAPRVGGTTPLLKGLGRVRVAGRSLAQARARHAVERRVTRHVAHHRGRRGRGRSGVFGRKWLPRWLLGLRMHRRPASTHPGVRVRGRRGGATGDGRVGGRGTGWGSN